MQTKAMKPEIALQKALEQNEANYWHALYCHRPDDPCGARASIIGGALAGMMTEIDMLACNRVIGLGMHRPVSEAEIDAIIETYKAAKISRFFVPLSPYAQPENIKEMLEQKGFSYYNNWTKLYRKAAVPIPPVPPAPAATPASPPPIPPAPAGVPVLLDASFVPPDPPLDESGPLDIVDPPPSA